MSTDKYYETTYTMTVLSQGELDPDMTPEDLSYEIHMGDCVGKFERTSMQELTEDQMGLRLQELGSDTDFFLCDHNPEVPDDDQGGNDPGTNSCREADCTDDGAERYSLGIYAGRYCDKHWQESGYRDEGPEGFDPAYAGESYSA